MDRESEDDRSDKKQATRRDAAVIARVKSGATSPPRTWTQRVTSAAHDVADGRATHESGHDLLRWSNTWEKRTYS